MYYLSVVLSSAGMISQIVLVLAGVYLLYRIAAMVKEGEKCLRAKRYLSRGV